MSYRNIKATLNASNSGTQIVLAATGANESLIVNDLQLLSSLSAPSAPTFEADSTRYIQLRLIDTVSGVIYDISLVPFFRRTAPSAADLLSYITLRESFAVAPNSQLVARLAPGSAPLTGIDSLCFYGQMQAPPATNQSAVSQTFVTANYAVPSRDGLQALSLSPNWSVFDVARPPRYYKDQIGRVHITGFVKQGTQNVNDVISILPAGFRPLEDLDFIVSSGNNLITTRVLTGGNLISFQASGAYLNLNGVSFLAA